MQFDQIEAYSEKSYSEALYKALTRAIWDSVDSANAHFIVQDMLIVDAGWKATVKVVMQSRAMAINTQSAKFKGYCKYWHRDASQTQKNPKQSNVKTCKHDQYLQLVKNKDKNSCPLERDKLRQALNIDIALLHLYLKDDQEEDFREIEDKLYFDSIHILGGALWEEANRHHPDIEMYEVAHNVQDIPAKDNDDQPKQKNVQSRLELIDRLSF